MSHLSKTHLTSAILLLYSLLSIPAHAQVGIGTTTPNAGAVLDINSSNQGVLLPRIASHADVTNPIDGLIIYDESDQCINFYANGSWVNPCETGSIASRCGDGYTSVSFRDVELSPEFVGIAVSEDNSLFVVGDFNDAYRAFGGMSTTQEIYDWTDYHDLALSITPPFNRGEVACADITNNTTNRNVRVIVGTTTGSIYTIQAPSSTWIAATTYPGSTPVEVEAGNGYTVLDDNGDVWYSTTGVTFDQVNIGPTITGIKAQLSEGLNSGYSTAYKHYAWNPSNDTLYYWTNSATSVSNFVLSAGITDVDQGTSAGASILLNDGTIYVYDGLVLGVTGGSTPTSTPLVMAPNNTRPLASGEYFVKLEMAHFDAVAVTNQGNFYTYSYNVGWYFEHEVVALDPNSVDLSGANDVGFAVVVDGQFYVWGDIATGTSDPYKGSSGTFGDAATGGAYSNATITMNSPYSINICREN